MPKTGLSGDERERLMRSRTDYLDLYGRLKDLPLAVPPETAHLLYMLARSTHARTVVEFGTSFGEGRLRPGAFIVADNADHNPDYLAHVRAPGMGYLSVPFGAEVEVSMRLG